MKLFNRIFGRFPRYRRFVGGHWVQYPRRWLPGKFWYRVCRKCHAVAEKIVQTGSVEDHEYWREDEE